jgi:hypothetical protein
VKFAGCEFRRVRKNLISRRWWDLEAEGKQETLTLEQGVMRRLKIPVFVVFAVVLILLWSECFADQGQDADPRDFIWGTSTNGLRPRIFVEKGPLDWHISIDFLFETNFPQHSWLRSTNRQGARIELSRAEAPPDIIATTPASQFPQTTTVAEVMRQVVPQSVRGLQWLQSGFVESRVGDLAFSASFGLGKSLNLQITNDVVVRLIPVAYRVDPDMQRARLVEFPAITLKLQKDGRVESEQAKR